MGADPILLLILAVPPDTKFCGKEARHNKTNTNSPIKEKAGNSANDQVPRYNAKESVRPERDYMKDSPNHK